jgi:2-C-methyl-D-erythritol 4-phosphate cytidylyltransferase/2-C-methyl-D-erythritol 2,4-cyclodiphosphate synthase
MKIVCIVLGSGSSTRFRNKNSKLFYKVKNHSVIEHTLKNISKSISKDCLYITIPKKITKKEKSVLTKYTENALILGGSTRYKSLVKALKCIDTAKYKYLMIHDAARPNTSVALVTKLIDNIKKNKYDAVVPALQIRDTLKKDNKTVNRNLYKTSQTPQIFKIKEFLSYSKQKNIGTTDDVQLIENKKNVKIKYIDGDCENLKITVKNDLNLFKKYLFYKTKIGNGFDIHRLGKGTYISIGGIKIKSNYKAIGHSDGDVVLHSVIDALLGANSKGDIGKFFPPLKKYKNISSIELLNKIKNKIDIDNSVIINLDITVICQKIRLEKYKTPIKNNLSKLLRCNKNLINIKGKTADHVGIFGKSEAIGCWATINLIN